MRNTRDSTRDAVCVLYIQTGVVMRGERPQYETVCGAVCVCVCVCTYTSLAEKQVGGWESCSPHMHGNGRSGCRGHSKSMT